MKPNRVKRILQSGLSRTVHPIDEQRETVLNQPSQQVLDLPYYPLLPRDPVELLKFRIYARSRALTDLEFRADLLQMCRDDICFFASVLVSVFEPRPPRDIPLTLWDDQSDCLVWMKECLDEERDLGISKSRGVGLSWNLSILYYHAWYFTPGAKLGVMTKDEQTLDGPDSNYLMGKFAFIHDHVPAWMKFDSAGRPILRRNQTEHIFYNLANEATYQGFPPVEAKVRGLRFTSFAYDEFAFFPRNTQNALNASSHTTPNRLFISTWNGPGDAFHDLMVRISSTMLRVSTFWWNNPERFKGAYRYENGRLHVLDTGYVYPKDYPFVEDGLLRSPWVDYELARPRTGSFQSALQELYGLQAESGRKFFSNVTVSVLDATVQQPDRRGNVVYVRGEPTFTPDRSGDVCIWGDVGEGKSGPFAAGVDPAFGRKAAYSAMSVLDLSTGEQVLEFATNTTPIVEFAQKCVLICRWLAGNKGDGHVYLNFENNQEAGISFGEEITRLGYGNVEKNDIRRVGRNKKPTRLGIRNSDAGHLIYTEMERAILEGEYVVRSAEVAEEAAAMDRGDDGKPRFILTDKGHGDRIMAAAIAWYTGRNRAVKRLSSTALAENYAQAVEQELTSASGERMMFSNVWRTTSVNPYGL